jgi:hypothetical protein
LLDTLIGSTVAGMSPECVRTTSENLPGFGGRGIGRIGCVLGDRAFAAVEPEVVAAERVPDDAIIGSPERVWSAALHAAAHSATAPTAAAISSLGVRATTSSDPNEQRAGEGHRSRGRAEEDRPQRQAAI